MARINRNKVMETARRAKDKGQFDKAIREYQKVVAEDPNDVRVLLKIGDLFAQKGAKAEATDTYTRVARLYQEQGFYLKSVAVYKQILKVDPRLVEINLRLAELYRQLGLLSDAMQHFEMVAAFFHREGKTREAQATLRQLVELDPENVATRIKLAELYSKEEMTEEAIAEFASACDFLRSHNRIDDFIKVAERLLWHNQDNIALNKELATLYLHRNDPRRALQKLQVCFKADGRDVDTLALLAQAFQALDQRGKTVSVLKELARILSESGKRLEADEVHRKILSYVPDDPDSLAVLGMTARSSAVDQVVRELEVADDMIMDEPGVAEFAHSPMGNPTGSFPLVRQASDAGYPDYGAAFPAGGDVSFGAVETSVDQEAVFASEFDLDEEPSYQSSVRGEANSDEIVKVLTETDVYVKYGLHQKAIEHLHRVFELDPDNIEARERLKDIFLSLGREREAISQLIHLASVVAPVEPNRASDYVRSVLRIDENHQEAHAIASRYRLDVTDSAELELVDGGRLDYGHDAIAFSREPSAYEYAAGSPVPGARPGTGDYGGQSAYGSNAPMTLDPEETSSSFDFEFDLDSSPEISQNYNEPPTNTDEVETPMGAVVADPSGSDIYTLSDDDIILEDEGGVTMEVSLEQVEAQIGLVESGSPIDLDDLEFDEALPTPVQPVPESESLANLTPALSAMAATDEHIDAPFLDDEEFIESRTHAEQLAGLPTTSRPDDVTVDVQLDELDAAIAADRNPRESAPPALEDDLDEADFFIAQGLYEEAREILGAAAARNPGHPLIEAKLADLSAGQVTGPLTPGAPIDPTVKRKPSVLLEKPVDDEDADTHFDLGLAYKEMGLYEEAIKAFTKVIHVAGRAVQCYLMLGLCHRERGDLSESITQFKAGLYVDQISTAEKYGLYYEIGSTYEQLEDPPEALYYYEMIVKKQPDYRDVSERVAALRERHSAKTGTV